MTEFLISDLFIEILGAITGLIYLYFSIKQNIWLWPWGIVTSLIYVYVFFQAKFYADMSLQLYYFGISIYGWYFWKRGSREQSLRLPIVQTGKGEWIVFIIVTLFLTGVSGYFLNNFTDSPIPYWDAFTTSGSIIATWMLARKYLEHWLVWIVVDLVSLGTYIYKGLYPTIILFMVYTGMAVVGYYQWKKELINQN